MRTYDDIKRIRDELYDLVNWCEEKNIGMYENEFEDFKKNIKQYDVVLSRIGVGGVNTDIDLEKGFDETELLLKKIKERM